MCSFVLIAEIPPTIDHLFGRASTDPRLKARTRNEVSCTGIFRHVARILVPHVDDRRPNLNCFGPGFYRRQQWQR